jgi:hypothetical protein
MSFRDRGTFLSLRQRAAQRLAEIEQEIRDIKRLFPDLADAPSHDRRRFRRGRDFRRNDERSSGRYLIH